MARCLYIDLMPPSQYRQQCWMETRKDWLYAWNGNAWCFVISFAPFFRVSGDEKVNIWTTIEFTPNLPRMFLPSTEDPFLQWCSATNRVLESAARHPSGRLRHSVVRKTMFEYGSWDRRYTALAVEPEIFHEWGHVTVPCFDGCLKRRGWMLGFQTEAWVRWTGPGWVLRRAGCLSVIWVFGWARR